MTVGNLVELILFQWAFVESIPTGGCSNCHHGGVIAAVIAVEPPVSLSLWRGSPIFGTNATPVLSKHS
jgi:hypothetical protein